MNTGKIFKRSLNPIRRSPASLVVGECVAYSNSIGQYIGESSIIGEAIQQPIALGAVGARSKLGDSSVIGEAISSPCWSNQFLGSSNVVGECIGEDSLGINGIDIYDEGILVKQKAAFIDIVGPDAAAVLDGLGVKIRHPAPDYVSHFNTTDGINDATVSNAAIANRYVAAPTVEGTPFYTNNWGGDGFTHPCINANPAIWSTANNCLFDDLNTSISVQISNITGIIATHSESNILGNLSTTANSITITVSGWTTDTDKYQADVTISVDLATLLPPGGYFDIIITHTSLGIPYVFSQ